MKTATLKNKVFLQIKQNKLQAETIATQNLEVAFKDENFKKTFLQIKTLNFDIAKKEFLNKPTSEDKKTLKELTETLKKQAENLGFKLQDFKPNYSCKKCNDEGLIKEDYCECFYKKLNKEIINNLGIKIDETNTFKNANFSLFQEPEEIKRIYNKLENWCENILNSSYKTLVISGKTGVGKTYLINCICNNLIQKNVVVNYYTAFALSDLFLKYRTTFTQNNVDILDGIMSCDVLIIDDLGSEPNLKNNEEYFYLLFNERLVRNKITIISTNLLPAQIMDRYGERTFSRLRDKRTSLFIKIENEDIRRK